MLKIRSIYQEMCMSLTSSVAACRVDSRPKAIHQLRTGTRKLEAVLGVLQREHRHAAEAMRASKDLLRVLKKLRKAAGAVRDFDVQRKLLASTAKTMAAKRGGERRSRVLAEEKELKKVLADGREASSKKLAKQLELMELRLQQSIQDCSHALERLMAKKTTAESCARRWIQSGVRFKVMQSGERLHAFRKETKGARYLAELDQESVTAVRLAERLHAVHDAIGAWHDFEILADVAQDSLGDDAVLAEEFDRRRKSAWKRACGAVMDFAKERPDLMRARIR